MTVDTSYYRLADCRNWQNGAEVGSDPSARFALARSERTPGSALIHLVVRPWQLARYGRCMPAAYPTRRDRSARSAMTALATAIWTSSLICVNAGHLSLKAGGTGVVLMRQSSSAGEQ